MRGSVHGIGYDTTVLDIEVDPQRRRFGSRKSDFVLQALGGRRIVEDMYYEIRRTYYCSTV